MKNLEEKLLKTKHFFLKEQKHGRDSKTMIETRAQYLRTKVPLKFCKYPTIAKVWASWQLATHLYAQYFWTPTLKTCDM